MPTLYPVSCTNIAVFGVMEELEDGS